jgi:hypothetical protein
MAGPASLMTEQLGGRLQELRRHAARDLVAGQVHLVDEGRVARGARDVLGQVDEHGARASGAGDVERLAHHPRDFGHVLDQVAVLDDGVGDARDVRLLEGVFAEARADGLPGEHDHRHRVHHGGQEARDGVGGAGTRGDEHHTGLARGARVAVGHVGGALFVAYQDELDAGIHEGVEDGDRGPARQTEHVVHALALETLNELLGAAGHPLVLTHGTLHLSGASRTAPAAAPRPNVATTWGECQCFRSPSAVQSSDQPRNLGGWGL